MKENRIAPVIIKRLERIHMRYWQANAMLAGLLQLKYHQAFEVEYRFQKDNDCFAYKCNRKILLKNNSTSFLRGIVTLNAEFAIENLLTKNQLLLVFRSVKETINNVIKQAITKLIAVSINHTRELIVLKTPEDGADGKETKVKEDAVINTTANQVYLINGNFTLESRPGKDCLIKLVRLYITQKNRPLWKRSPSLLQMIIR